MSNGAVVGIIAGALALGVIAYAVASHSHAGAGKGGATTPTSGVSSINASASGQIPAQYTGTPVNAGTVTNRAQPDVGKLLVQGGQAVQIGIDVWGKIKDSFGGDGAGSSDPADTGNVA